jgi:AraC-like DNA-binding protein
MSLYQPFPMLSGRRAQAWLHHPAYRRPRHFHAEPELNLVFRGRAKMGVGDLTFEMSAGHVLLLRPGQDHELLEASEDLELVVAALTPELAVRCLSRSLPAASHPFRLSPAECSAVRCELLSLAAASHADNHERIVSDMFGRSESRFDRGHPTARRTLTAVTARPHVMSSEVAAELDVPPSEVSRHFHRHLGVPLVEFRSRLRLMRFIHLVDSGSSFARAAFEASFGSYAQCHRTFREYLGCGPREYFTALREQVNTKVEPRPDMR